MSLITLNHLNWQCTMRSVQLNKNIQSYSLAGRWCASMWGEGLTSTSDTTNHRIDPNTLRPSRTCWRYHRSLRREIVDRHQWLVRSTRVAHSYHTSPGRSSADTLLHVHNTRTAQHSRVNYSVAVFVMLTDSLSHLSQNKFRPKNRNNSTNSLMQFPHLQAAWENKGPQWLHIYYVMIIQYNVFVLNVNHSV